MATANPTIVMTAWHVEVVEISKLAAWLTKFDNEHGVYEHHFTYIDAGKVLVSIRYTDGG